MSTLAIVLIAGFLLLLLVLKIAKGVIKLVLIIVLIALIAGGAMMSRNDPIAPTETTL